MSPILQVRWGVIATGNMASKFIQDLLLDPATRGVHDVKHVLRAVASSTSAERATSFAQSFSPDAVGYGSISELLQDPAVDAVYIASPTSKHYEHVLMALNAGKAVLCEKAFTINAAQAEHLFRVSREKKVYLAEALWTRYFPIFQVIRHTLHTDRVLGNLHRVVSDVALNFAKNDIAHSMRNGHYGGGALLGVGVYPLTWALVALGEHPDNEGELPQVTASMVLADSEEAQRAGSHPTDDQTLINLVYPKLRATASVSCNVITKSLPNTPPVVIQGELGNLIIEGSTYHPDAFTIELFKTSTTPAHSIRHDASEFPIPGKGLFFQADALARSLKEGRIEPHESKAAHSIAMMRVLDEVRKHGGLQYPSAVEAVDL